MTERKPPGVEWQSWVERQLEEARREGLLDNLEGEGKPIPGLGESRDDDWWVKEKLRREGVSWVPPTLAIRAERVRRGGRGRGRCDRRRTASGRRAHQRAHSLREQPHGVGSANHGLDRRPRADRRALAGRASIRADRGPRRIDARTGRSAGRGAVPDAFDACVDGRTDLAADGSFGALCSSFSRNRAVRCAHRRESGQSGFGAWGGIGRDGDSGRRVA